MTTEKSIYDINNFDSDIIPDLEPKPLSTKELRQKVAQAISYLESQGIRDWEILEAWSNLTWKAGHRKATKVLETAAQELKDSD